MSPPHTDTDMECTPENETAAAIIGSLKNSLKVDGISPNLESPSNDIDVVMTDTNEVCTVMHTFFTINFHYTYYNSNTRSLN